MEGMEGPTMGTEPSARGTHVGIFSCKTHVDLSSRLVEGCTFVLTEELANTKLDCSDQVTLLVVAYRSEYK
jgi:hypothetical protein